MTEGTATTKNAEIAYLVTYRCACCQAWLQAPAERLSAWLRCPTCGKGGLPPDRVVRRRPVAPPSPGEDILLIGPPPELPAMTPVSIADPVPWAIQPAVTVASTTSQTSPRDLRPDRSDDPGSGLRVAYASVLFLSLTLLLFSYLDQSVMGTAICGGLGIVALVLLVLSGRPRPRD